MVNGIEQHPDWALIAEVDGEVVGYATYMIDGEVGEVGNNAVHPDRQGRGSARL